MVDDRSTERPTRAGGRPPPAWVTLLTRFGSRSSLARRRPRSSTRGAASLRRLLPILAAGAWVLVPTASLAPAASAAPVGAADGTNLPTPWRVSSVLAGPAHTAAEPAVAVDPHDPRHLAVAGDPYLTEARVSVAVSHDGGSTWAPPIDIVPAGYAKSYDPTLLFSKDGRLTVVGGASRLGARHCQPGSAIFVAAVHDDRSVDVRLVADQHPADTYVDRPTAAIDPRSDDVYVSWTQSSGAGAECRGTPSSSYLLLAKGAASGPFTVLPGIPSSGLPAPFGAALGIDAGGVLWAAVGEHVPGRQTRLSVTSSADGGKTFATPTVLEDGGARPATIPGLGGINAPIPSLTAGGAGEVIVSWPMAGTKGAHVAVYQHHGTGWDDRSVPSAAGVTPFLSAAVVEAGGGAVLLTASVDNGSLVFEVRGGTGAWSAPERLASAPSGGYQEVGEGLGLVAASGVTAWALPVDSPASSALTVGTRESSPGSATTSTPTSGAPASGGGGGGGGGGSAGRSWTTTLAGAVLIAAVLAVVALRATRTARGRSGPRRR
ncbi:MAG: hypothetical protein JWN46_3896 [Acidimicrobiales bacterium]|nr:hypothetical protein [Acidimicrobiales bacterium]